MFCESCGNEIVGEQARFCTTCGVGIQASSPPPKVESRFFKNKFLWLGIPGALILGAVLIYIILARQRSPADNIASLVVNIYCESEFSEDVSGGSGTIFSEGGLILTNAHIIPVNDATGKIDEHATCFVTLPDPTTGSPQEMYWAYPIIASGLSETYDLAFIQIHDVYYDTEEGVAYGDYPKKFPSYTGNQCKDENVRLGESVRVYGYPAISGGIALTITDGVVSSLLPDEGFILTSAKISHGNSGGIAVDQYGCMIGVPSMVSGDENESLGVIISNDLIGEFMEEIKASEI
jgi:hypothetical protein